MVNEEIKPKRSFLELDTGIEAYMQDYYSKVVSNPKRRERLIQKARFIVHRNIAENGTPDFAHLHNTLELILDNSGKSWSETSMDADLTGDGFNLHSVLPAKFTLGESDLKKGYELAKILQQTLKKDEFDSLVSMFKGFNELIYLLDRSNLTARDLVKDKSFFDEITWTHSLPEESRELYAKYKIFKQGDMRYNPLRALDSSNTPIIQRIILKLYEAGKLNRNNLRNEGFSGLMSLEGGLAGIVTKTIPEVAHKIPYMRIWRLGEASSNIALRLIEKALYSLPGYKEAEESRDRDEQIRILTNFVRTKQSLQKWFQGKELRGLIREFGGLKKKDSPKAALEFYSERKGLNWFDRSQEHYIRGWHIPHKKMWTGRESIQFALEAVRDCLYELPGYKQAEKSGDRKSQVKILNDWLKEEKRLFAFFRERGLVGMMHHLIDTEGKKVLRKSSSPKSVLEFYSERKGLNWFDRSQEHYIQRWRIRDTGVWKRGEESVQLALEAIEDTLYTISGYKEAEKNKDRDEQVKIINDFLKKEKKLADYFYERGLQGMMLCFSDPKGKTGFKKKGSPKAVLEFYSERKGLNWFDRSQEVYLQLRGIRQQKIWNPGGEGPEVWRRKETSINLALKTIADVLYDIPNYREAEESRDRDEQIRVIANFLDKKSDLCDYFYEKGLQGLMTIFYDSSGKRGLRKRGSPKAVLDFYSERKGLNWFDRSQNTHLQEWKIVQHGMWKKGEESVKLGLEAIQDVLYTIQGYKEAEKSRDRNEQIRIMNNWISREKKMTEFFRNQGLGGLMSGFVDPSGKIGVKKAHSPKAVLEFYSDKKSLNWFDRSQETYVPGWKIMQQRAWKRGEESVQLALEAIQDVLYGFPEYKQAEQSGNRNQQITIIEELASQGKIVKILKKELRGLMGSLIDSSGKRGFKKLCSAKSVLEFYSERKGLNWFDRSQETYVPGWKVRQWGMWSGGEESVQLALEAIQDVLYTIPGYREAEKNEDRANQINCIKKIMAPPGLQMYFANQGLAGLMTNASNLFERGGSPRAVLEFYSDRKGLSWFDEAQGTYLNIQLRKRA